MVNNRSSKSLIVFLVLNLALFVFGQGTQFITGACTSDADCASGCCGFNSGKCAGAVVAQERDGGCGFGDAQPNDNAAKALTGGQATSPAPTNTASTGNTGNTGNNSNTGSTGSATNVDQSAPGAANVGKGDASQFITGQCTSDADCASGCCGFNTGKCAGAVIAQTRDGGCGFGDAQSNDAAAQALTGGAAQPTTAATSNTGNTGSTGNTSNTGSTGNTGTTGSTGGATNVDQSAPGAANVGKANASQFITGQCTSDADCASGCCGFNTGKCAGAVIAQTRDGGCGFGDAQSNDNAAKALTGAGKRDVEFRA